MTITTTDHPDETMTPSMLPCPSLATYPRIEVITCEAGSGAARAHVGNSEALAKMQERGEAVPARIEDLHVHARNAGSAA